MPGRARLILGATLLLSLPRPASAQELFDQGVFIIARGGAQTGQAEFAIRSAAGPEGRRGLLVVATTRTPAREVAFAQEISDLVPTTFQQTETVGGRVVRRVAASLSGRRFSARASSADRDMARELPVRSPFVILGDEDYTAYYFMPRPDSGVSGPLTVFRTRDLVALNAAVEGLGADTLTVGGRRLACRRYALHLPDENDRQFWVTDNGTLVQVAVPAAGLTATRAEAPSR